MSNVEETCETLTDAIEWLGDNTSELSEALSDGNYEQADRVLSMIENDLRSATGDVEALRRVINEHVQ